MAPVGAVKWRYRRRLGELTGTMVRDVTQKRRNERVSVSAAPIIRSTAVVYTQTSSADYQSAAVYITPCKPKQDHRPSWL